MSSGRVLARNSILSLAGHIVPLGVAIIAIPPLIRGLGAERFAILTLAWAAIGYLGVFELGLGRALTQSVAKRLATGATSELGPLAWTTLWALLLLGVLAGLLFALGAPALVLRVLNVPPALQGETLTAFFILAASLPFVIGSIGFRSIMEAHQDFGITTAIRIPVTTLMFLGPLIAIGFSRSLAGAVAAVVATRVVGFVLYAVYSVRNYAYLHRPAPFDRAVLAPLAWYGAWSTVSNVVSPMMVILDRFLIGALLPLAAVAHYVTPYEAVTKLLLIPIAVLSAMFPAFSAVAGRDPQRMEILYDRSLRIVAITMFPLALVGVVLAHEALFVWVGNALPPASTFVLQWLAVGIFVNGIAQPPLTALQGAGRPDLIAKLHLAELPFYLVGIVLFTRSYGLVGVAIAWTLRVTVDAIALLLLARRTLGLPFAPTYVSWLSVSVMIACFGVGALLERTPARLLFAGVALLVFLPIAWRLLLAPGERAALGQWLRMPRQPALPHPDASL